MSLLAMLFKAAHIANTTMRTIFATIQIVQMALMVWVAAKRYARTV